ncbi:helix-turn-helix domain-containing protein [bacterium]|nr:helix-turn-helix domain-containing protein [bacterium]
MPGNQLVQSLSRGLEILQFLAHAEGAASLGDVANALGVKKPTAHNLLRTLASQGFVEQSGRGYGLGWAISELAMVERNGDLLHRAAGEIRELYGGFPQGTLIFSEVLRDRTVVSLRMSPDQRGILQRPAGLSFGLYVSVSGLVAQAFATPDHLDQMRLRESFWEHGARVWGSLEHLGSFLEDVREKGYGEFPFDGESALRLGFPVRRGDWEPVGVLGMHLTWTRGSQASRRDAPEIIRALGEAAGRLSVLETKSRGERNAER